MRLSGNTILITGGNSGIGRGLAEAFHKRGNAVIITGRDAGKLSETLKANPGMHGMELDVEDAAAIKDFAARIVRDFPELNVIINNAGIMRAENLNAPPDYLADSESIITTNLLGPIRLIAALMPHLGQQESAAILNVTSGLAFVPLAHTPTYCATKAAMHSYTQSLRQQFKQTSVQVIEVAPPAVATKLMPGTENDPIRMPLANYIAETMSLLETQPNAEEILVERVKNLRNAESSGKYAEVLAQLNSWTPPAK